MNNLTLHVCGSRDIHATVVDMHAPTGAGQLSDTQINRLFARCLYAIGVDQHQINEVVHGGNVESPDVWGSRWADNHQHIENNEFEADWDAHGRAAGPIRNSEMVEYLTDKTDTDENVVAIAFWDGESTGTEDMISKLESNEIPPTVFRLDDESTRDLLFGTV